MHITQRYMHIMFEGVSILNVRGGPDYASMRYRCLAVYQEE